MTESAKSCINLIQNTLEYSLQNCSDVEISKILEDKGYISKDGKITIDGILFLKKLQEENK
jgi:hypothetical protein